MEKNKLFLLREKIFAIVCLFITAVFCIVKVIISLARTTKFLDWMVVEFEENPDLSNFNSIKIILITVICITCLFLLCSFLPLLFKNQNVKRSFIIVGLTILILVIIFFFICKFIEGDYFTVEHFKDEDFESGIFCLEVVLTSNFVYMVFVSIISLIIAIICSSINIENKIQSEVETMGDVVSEEEKTMQEEIGKLKAQLRIKDLEKQYLDLKTKLDS